jgi:hypothetical protein
VVINAQVLFIKRKSELKIESNLSLDYKYLNEFSARRVRTVQMNRKPYLFVSKSKIHQHCILPRKYNRQRRQLLFLVCLQVSGKVGLWKKTVDSSFGRSSLCFFFFSFYYFTQKVWYGSYHLFIHNNYFVLRNKHNSLMSNFGGTLSQPKKIKFILGISSFLPT